MTRQKDIYDFHRIHRMSPIYESAAVDVIRYKQAGFVEGDQLWKWVDELLRDVPQ